MRKGLTQTLMTVAVAMLSLQAMAMAPVIGDIPSPIVGGSGAVTQANRFVYPDAINLNNYVSDQETTNPAQIKWSYEVVPPAKYMINGVNPITTSDPANIMVNPGTKQINASANIPAGEQNPDGKAETITVRNSALSPLGGTEQPQGSTTGILAGQTQIVTLYASDGTTYSEKDVFFYTDNGGADRLSPGWELIKNLTFEGTTEQFTFVSQSGTVTTSTSNGQLCMQVPLSSTADNVGIWAGPENTFTPVAKSVYHLRATMNGSNATAGATPFWDLIVDNPYNGTTQKGRNYFGLDCYFLDNAGGANALLNKTGGTDYHLWFAPLAVDAPQFNDATKGAFVAAKQADLRCRVMLRVMDVQANPSITANQDQGSICMMNLRIIRHDLAAMQTLQSNVWSVSSFVQTTSSANGNVLVDQLGSALSFAGGACQVTPNAGAGANVELCWVSPGTNWAYDPTGNPSTISDNFPVPWTADTLYQFVYELRAPSVAAEANAFDIIVITCDSVTNEANMEALIANQDFTDRCTAPKYNGGVSQKYMAFYYTHKPTANTTAQWKFVRPMLGLQNNGQFVQGNNQGGAVLTKCTVNKVNFVEN